MTDTTLADNAAETPVFDLVVVGAGPAGLSAALTASDHGLRVVVVDEQHDVGGQIFRQAPSTFRGPPSSAFKSYAFGQPLLERARRSQSIEWRFGATAWGVFRPEHNNSVCVAIAQGDHTELLEGRALIVATGAYDLPVAFPGWTLPGVMSAGGVQTLVKSQFIRPGKRFVLAGSHPLLLLVADLLVQAGAEVVEVAIARPRPALKELLAGWPAVPGHLGLLAQTAQSLRRVLRHGVPIRFGTLVLRAEGDEAVQRVTLCNADHDWQAVPGTERTVDADTLVVGFGLLASSELARQAGCVSEWKPAEGGWVVQHDEGMRTSVERVYVAGEPAGVQGAELAFLEGRLAALSVVADAHPGAPLPKRQDAQHKTRRAIAQAHRFTDVVLRFFAPRLDALARLPTADTVVCRCEEVTLGTVQRFLADNPHVSDVNSVKLACRTGMGFCQGRYCQHTVAHVLAQARQTAVKDLGVFTAQVPVKPISVAALGQLKLN
jgi:thioredoxin reductase